MSLKQTLFSFLSLKNIFFTSGPHRGGGGWPQAESAWGLWTFLDKSVCVRTSLPHCRRRSARTVTALFAHAPPAPLPQRPGPGWGCCRACRSARSRENGRKAELCEHQQAFERVFLTLTLFSNFFFSESQPHPCFWGWAGQGSEVKTELTQPRLPAQPPLVFLCLDSALSRLPVHHGVPYGGSHSK